MASALSVDLRERVVAAIEAGASRREAARCFEISPASTVRWHGVFVQEGRMQAKPMGGDQRSDAIDAQNGIDFSRASLDSASIAANRGRGDRSEPD